MERSKATLLASKTRLLYQLKKRGVTIAAASQPVSMILSQKKLNLVCIGDNLSL
jgi:hypothetical protein